MGVAILAVEKFLEQRRVLYAAPTTEQVERFWTEVSRALQEPIDAKIFSKNETEHVIEIPRTETRIRAKTAWDADTLRGDYAGFLILDEWQLMNEDMWELVGAPMLLDCDGDACFIYTPPSIHGRRSDSGKTIRTKARDPQHAAKMFAAAEQDKTGRWAAFHFTSHDNPHISKAGLKEIIRDMTSLAYRMEIMAEDVNEAPGALWKREMIQRATDPGEMARVVVGVDPSATSEGDEAGIVVVGGNNEKAFVLADESLQGSPLAWATAAVTAYHVHKADRVVAESNQGGEMVAIVIGQVDSKVPVTLVHASRGKQTRAEPIAAQYEQGRVHHVGDFPELEDEMCLWVPGDASPNRLDACFPAGTMIETIKGEKAIETIFPGEQVLTREGFKRVLNSGFTGKKRILRLMLSSGIILPCTPNHSIYVCEKGWIPAWKLQKGIQLLGLKSRVYGSKELNLGAIPKVEIRPRQDIFSPMSTGTGLKAFRYCIERYGESAMDRFLRDAQSTIKMEILGIMKSLIWNVSQSRSMAFATAGRNYQENDNRWIMPEHLPLSGMEAKRGSSGTKNTEKRHGKGEFEITLLSVPSAVNHSNLIFQGKECASVPGLVSSNTTRRNDDITSKEFASSVRSNSPLRNPKSNQYAPAFVLGKSEGKIEPVYNLEVEDCPEYFANGILVHNCVWALTELMLGETPGLFFAGGN